MLVICAVIVGVTVRYLQVIPMSQKHKLPGAPFHTVFFLLLADLPNMVISGAQFFAVSTDAPNPCEHTLEGPTNQKKKSWSEEV